LNPGWNEPSSNVVRNTLFKEAMMLTQKEFLAKVTGIYKSWLPARAIVVNALTKGSSSSSKSEGEEKSTKKLKISDEIDNQLLILSEFCPWIDHLFEIEQENNIVGQFKYCLFPDSSGGFRVRAVPEAPGSFASRKALPTPWRALRDEELSKLTGIDGCVFVHNSGFIGGNRTFEGALEMARAAIRFED
jgi:urease accessory protein